MPNFNLPEGWLFADQFRILKLFASGAFGDVYSASDTKSNVNVAIKVVDFSEHPSLEDRFRKEASILATISHPNIMRLISVGDATDADGRAVWYMATELISGRTVWNRVQKEGPFEIEEAVDIIGQACDALQHVHEELAETILHRDLKPDNLMLERGKTVKVLDFGIAKEWDVNDSMSTIQAGHPAFAAPEQLNKGRLSRASDLYSLAKSLSTMITGEIPPMAQVTEWPAQAMAKPHAAEVLAVVRRTTSDNMAERPQRAAEFKNLLFQAIGRASGVAAAPIAPATPPPVQPRPADEDLSTLPEPAGRTPTPPPTPKPSGPVSAPAMKPTPKPGPTSTDDSEDSPMKTVKTIIITLLVVAVVGLAGYAFRDKIFGAAGMGQSGTPSGQVTSQGGTDVFPPMTPPLPTAISLADFSSNTVAGQPAEVIDWENGRLVVIGTGVASAERYPAIANRREAARISAEMDGLAKMAQALGRVRVTVHGSRSIELSNYVQTVDLEETVRGAIRDPRTIEKWESDGSLTLLVRYTLPRRNWPQPTRQQLAPTAAPEATQDDIPAEAKQAAQVAQAGQTGPFTGIIIDARGKGLRPGMSPTISIEGQNQAVYQFSDVNAITMNEKGGMVGYARSVDAARAIADRAGSNPLVLEATSASGTTANVSAEDAARILNADSDGADLRLGCKVVFIVG